MDDAKLILIEGCDGSGKSTLVKDLTDFINENTSIFAENISYPDKNAYGYDKIREILRGESFCPPDVLQSLFILNIIDSNEKYVNNFFKEKNKILFIDRSIISTILYNELQKGTIFHSISNYIKCKLNISFGVFDIDIINKEYCHMSDNIHQIYFLQPPLDIVLNHAKNRLLQNNIIEENDKVENVIKQYNIYKHTANIFKENKTNIFILDEWNYKLSESENYNNFLFKIIKNLNPERGEFDDK